MPRETHLKIDELAAISPEPDKGLSDLFRLVESNYLAGGTTQTSLYLAASYLVGHLEAHTDLLSISPPKFESTNEVARYIDAVRFKIATLTAKRQALESINGMKDIARVKIDEGYKSNIRELIGSIRKEIDRADIDSDRKHLIIKRLNAFANEIEKQFTDLQALGRFIITITGFVGDASKKLEPAVRLVERMRKQVAEAEESARNIALPAPEAQLQLPPPGEGQGLDE
ncbi:hypothetical protein [Azospirillum sp. B2RO_4]|uniref:hypothetical protein n=1 Tax=Azospirillum sp. B2RO_4 TaxID=3027796 RepID=UPI003DA89E57